MISTVMLIGETDAFNKLLGFHILKCLYVQIINDQTGQFILNL